MLCVLLLQPLLGVLCCGCVKPLVCCSAHPDGKDSVSVMEDLWEKLVRRKKARILESSMRSCAEASSSEMGSNGTPVSSQNACIAILVSSPRRTEFIDR